MWHSHIFRHTNTLLFLKHGLRPSNYVPHCILLLPPAVHSITLWPWPFDLKINECRWAVISNSSTDVGVNCSGRYPFGARTDGHTQTDSCGCSWPPTNITTTVGDTMTTYRRRSAVGRRQLKEPSRRLLSELLLLTQLQVGHITHQILNHYSHTEIHRPHHHVYLFKTEHLQENLK